MVSVDSITWPVSAAIIAAYAEVVAVVVVVAELVVNGPIGGAVYLPGVYLLMGAVCVARCVEVGVRFCVPVYSS